LIVIPGFGAPHILEKLEILKHNLTFFEPLHADIHIFCYSEEAVGALGMLEVPCMKVTYEKGIIAQFLHRHITPHVTDRYDRIIITLDDVQFDSSVDFAKLWDLKIVNGLDVVSPVLAERKMSWWAHMIHDPSPKASVIRRLTMTELFCYVMDKEAYKKYYNFIDPANPWTWGMDFLIYHEMKLNVALVNNMCMHHHFSNPRLPEHSDPRIDAEAYLAKYGLTMEQASQRNFYLRP
jgi:hypothetical protein